MARRGSARPGDSRLSLPVGVHRVDARQLARWFAQHDLSDAPFITTTITSPPYADLKDYGEPNQIGWAQSYDEYLADCRTVFRDLFDATRIDGTLWLIADSIRIRDPSGSRLEPLPFRLADEAAKVGWTLRDVIVWEKDRSLPWSGPGRLRNTFEYVLQLVKSEQFKYAIDRIRNPSRLEEWWVRFPERYHPLGKVPTNVWPVSIPRQGSWKPTTAAPHACPLPGELVERLILLSTDAGDVVFDPFAGVGSVVAHAERLGRHGLGAEINAVYVDAYTNRVRQQVTAPSATMTDKERVQGADRLTETIVKLRVLKLARVLLEAAHDFPEELRASRPTIAAVLSRVRRPPELMADGKWARARLIAVSAANASVRSALRSLLVDASRRRPASKFGVDIEVEVVRPRAFEARVGRKTLYRYLSGRTWHVDRKVVVRQALREARSDTAELLRHPPILSNLRVEERPRSIG